MVHGTGKVEDHTAVVPETLGYSGLFESFYRFYMSLPHRNAFAKDINLHYGFPPFGKFEKEVKEFKPDLVILRERSRPFCTTSVLCGQSRLISNMILCTASSGAAARNTESLRQGRSGLT